MQFKRLPELDFFRVLAITLVFAAHFYVVIGNMQHSTGSTFLDVLILNGSVGVDLFFVLSGFLLPYTIFIAKSKNGYSLGKYFRTRLKRIVPAYYFSILMIIIITPVLLTDRAGIFNILTHLLFIHHFFPQYYASLSGVAWTLSVEMQFYILLPLLYALAFRSLRGVGALVIASVIVSWGWRYLTHIRGYGHLYGFTYAYDQIVGRIDQFAIGIFLSYLFIHHHDRLLKLPKILMTALFVAGLGSYLLWIHFFGTAEQGLFTIVTIRTWYAAAFGIAMMASLFMHETFRAVITTRTVQYLAKISYGFYLWHLVIMWQLQAYRSLPMPYLFLCSLTLALAISAISYHFIEVPFLSHLNRDDRR